MTTWRLSNYTTSLESSRAIIQRVFFTLVLYGLALNFLNHVGLYQIGNNPLLFVDLDPLYWTTVLLQIPRLLTGFPALLFDILLTICCVGSIIRAEKKQWPTAFLLLYYVYFLMYNMRTGHHYTNPAILILGIAFVVNTPRRFAALFTLGRLVFCFMMFSAAIWKIARANLLHPEHARNLLITYNLEDLVNNNHSGWTGIVFNIIAVPWLPQVTWIVMILIELSFLAGFCTLRWDKWLLAGYLAFFIGGWLLFGIYSYENLLFPLTLSPLVRLMNKRTFAR